MNSNTATDRSFGTGFWEPWFPRVLVTAVIAFGSITGAAQADYTFLAHARIQGGCGGGCTSAQVEVLLSVSPVECAPDCTATPLIKDQGLCAPLSSVKMHIVDSGDDCANADVTPFPIDLQAGPFVITNAQLASLSANEYVVRVKMAADFVCDNTEDPPGSGIKKVCTTLADCDPGGSCIAIGEPWDWLEKIFGYSVPTLSEWSVAVMTILLLSAGTIVFRRHGAHSYSG